MPHEVRDPYSQAKIFIPTQQEKSIKQMEIDLQNKLDKLDKVDELLDKLDKVDELLGKLENKERKEMN